MHKPVLAQHAAFLVKLDNGNADWLRAKFPGDVPAIVEG